MKLEHKCAFLTKQAVTADNAKIALKKQSDKQLELIVKLQEREKNLSEQVGLLDKELAEQGTLLELERQKVASGMMQMTTLKGQMEQLNRKCENVLFKVYLTFKACAIGAVKDGSH